MYIYICTYICISMCTHIYLYVHRYIDFIYFNFQITLRFKIVNQCVHTDDIITVNSWSSLLSGRWATTVVYAVAWTSVAQLQVFFFFVSAAAFSWLFQKQLTLIKDTKSWQFSCFFCWESTIFHHDLWNGIKTSFLTKICNHLHIPILCRFS